MTHYCKNGDEIKVGGVYEYDFAGVRSCHAVTRFEGFRIWDADGFLMANEIERELPRDIDGYYLWQGKECPVPGEWEIEANGLYGIDTRHARHHTWGNVSRFRVISTGEDVQEVEQPTICEQVNALDVQEGGDHYKKMKIQPMEFSMANGLDACQHTIVKYVCRFRDKNGIEDLRKAKHCIDLLIQLEYGE